MRDRSNRSVSAPTDSPVLVSAQACEVKDGTNHSPTSPTFSRDSRNYKSRKGKEVGVGVGVVGERPQAIETRLKSLANGSSYSPSALTEFWLERASIREFDAGIPRAQAERLALQDVEDELSARPHGSRSTGWVP